MREFIGTGTLLGMWASSWGCGFGHIVRQPMRRVRESRTLRSQHREIYVLLHRARWMMPIQYNALANGVGRVCVRRAFFGPSEHEVLVPTERLWAHTLADCQVELFVYRNASQQYRNASQQYSCLRLFPSSSDRCQVCDKKKCARSHIRVLPTSYSWIQVI